MNHNFHKFTIIISTFIISRAADLTLNRKFHRAPRRPSSCYERGNSRNQPRRYNPSVAGKVRSDKVKSRASTYTPRRSPTSWRKSKDWSYILYGTSDTTHEYHRPTAAPGTDIVRSHGFYLNANANTESTRAFDVLQWHFSEERTFIRGL